MESLSASLREKLMGSDEDAKVVCRFKKKELLRITLRDILKKADLTETMLELSMLADVIVDESLKVVKKSLSATYGEPEKMHLPSFPSGSSEARSLISVQT